MRRRLLNLLSAVSVLALVATSWAWARSYSVTDVAMIPLSYVPAPQTHQTPFGYSETFETAVMTNVAVASSPGGLCLRWWRMTRVRPKMPFQRYSMPAEPDADSRDWDKATTRWRAAGFMWAQGGGGESYRRLDVPYWALATCTCVLPAVWLRRRLVRTRRATRAKSGRCPECGYDLRAASARCPECGVRTATSNS